MSRSNRYSPEVRERAVRLVFDHEHDHPSQWAAIRSVAEKIGCTAETLRNWIRQAERDHGRRADPTTDERARIKELERENRELRRANEILRKPSASRMGHPRSPRRSSTAHRRAGPRRYDDRVHRRPPRGLRSRADLRGAADRSVDLLRRQGP